MFNKTIIKVRKYNNSKFIKFLNKEHNFDFFIDSDIELNEMTKVIWFRGCKTKKAGDWTGKKTSDCDNT